MAIKVAIIGDTGTGKSTSYRNIDKGSTYIFHCDSKSLPFPETGFKIKHVSDVNWITRKMNELSSPLGISAQYNKIIIDTLNGIMLDDEMARMRQKDYDKWIDLAQSVYTLCARGHLMRQDQIIYYFFHEESWQDDDGIRNIRIKTSGKKLNKIILETKFTIILRSIKIGVGRDTKYGFEIFPNNTPTKLPFGFEIPEAIDNGDSVWVPNDLDKIDLLLRKFYNVPTVPTPIMASNQVVFPVSDK